MWNKYIWSERGYNLEDPTQQINGFTVSEIFGGTPTKSGVSVNANSALTVSAAWRAVQILGGAASSIPCQPFKKTDKGRQQIDSHPTYDMLTKRVNKKYTPSVWFDRVINHLHLKGNHFALPVRNSVGVVYELILIKPEDVEVYELANEVIYKFRGDENKYSSDEVIHVPHLGDGILGLSTIQKAKEDFGLEIARRNYGAEVYEAGGQVQGILNPKNNIDDPKRIKAQEAWREAKKTGKDVVMPFGFEYQKLTQSLTDVEFLQSGNFSVSTIARWFGVPPHKLFDLDRATWSNVEQMGLEFLTDTIAPILVKIEDEYTSKIYQLPRETKYYMEFNMSGYARADLKTRAESFAAQIHSGQLKPSEARAMENRDFVEGSDRLFINQGSAPLDLLDEILKKNKVTQAQKEKLKGLFNGRTQEILDILQ